MKENSKYAVVLIVFVQVTGFIPHGMNLVVLNPATAPLKLFINQTNLERYGESATGDSIDLQINLAQMMLIAGTASGAFLAHLIVANFSRKRCLQLTHVGTVLSAILMAPVAYYSRCFEPIIVGRFVCGLCRGLGMIILPLYVAETSSRRSLALYQATATLVMNLGTVAGNAVGLPQALGTAELWPILLASPAIMSLAFLLLSTLIPETVGYLIQRGESSQEAAGSRSYALLRSLRIANAQSTRAEHARIVAEIESDVAFEKATMCEVMRQPAYRRQLVACVVVMVSMQLGGIQILVQYSNTVFEEAGVASESSTLVTVGCFSYLTFVTTIGVLLVPRYGARKLFLIGTAMVEAGLILLVASSVLHNQHHVPGMAYVNVAAVTVVMTGMMIGTNWSVFVLPAELTTQVTRPTAIWCGNCMFWIVATIIVFVTPFTLKSWSGYAYLPFVFLTLAEIIFVWKKVPNTHKRSAAQIQAGFGRKPSADGLKMEGLISPPPPDDSNVGKVS